MLSGHVVWCNVCGAFGSQRGRGLARACPGPAQIGGTGGRAQQLRRLRAGYHPKDRVRLPNAVPQSSWTEDELSHAQKSLAAIPGLLDPHLPGSEQALGLASDDDLPTNCARERTGQADMPSAAEPPTAEDSVADILRRTEFGRHCLQTLPSKRAADQVEVSDAQRRMEALRRRVQLREASAAGTPREEGLPSVDLTQELETIIRDEHGASGTPPRRRPVAASDEEFAGSCPAGDGGSATSQAPVPAEKKPITADYGDLPPPVATAEEIVDLRALRRRQAASGGHPLGESDEEDQPEQWDWLELQEYRTWVGTGRPDVVLQGRPSPGAWDHPWVTYCAHVDSYGIQDGRQLLVADEPAGHLTRRAVDPEAATDGEYAVSARRPGVPPRPTMSAAARAQLEAVLPPPPDFGPRPATGLLSTTMLLTLTGKRGPIADVLLGAKRARSLGTSDDRSNAAPGGSGHSGGDEGHSSSMLPSLATQPPPPARGTKRSLAPGPDGDFMRAPLTRFDQLRGRPARSGRDRSEGCQCWRLKETGSLPRTIR